MNEISESESSKFVKSIVGVDCGCSRRKGICRGRLHSASTSMISAEFIRDMFLCYVNVF